jgi:hypothetical protein
MRKGAPRLQTRHIFRRGAGVGHPKKCYAFLGTPARRLYFWLVDCVRTSRKKRGFAHPIFKQGCRAGERNLQRARASPAPGERHRPSAG